MARMIEKYFLLWLLIIENFAVIKFYSLIFFGVRMGIQDCVFDWKLQEA